MEWVAGLPHFLYIPKIQAYLHLMDGTLVFNDCMETGQYSAMGWGYRLGRHG